MMQVKNIEPFHARNVNFNFSLEYIPGWFSNDFFLSHFMDTLSLSVEMVEPYLNKSILQFKQEKALSELNNTIHEFIKQEATHTREHRKYNIALRNHHYDIENIQKNIRSRLLKLEKLPQIDQLAVAVVMELFTESISEWWMRHGNYRVSSNPFTEIWSWHCTEELEHKNVLYEAYLRLGGSKKKLCFYLVSFLIPTFFKFYVRTFKMLKKDNKTSKIISKKSITLMFGKKGLFPVIFLNIFRIMKKDYNLKNDEYKKITSWWYLNKDKFNE